MEGAGTCGGGGGGGGGLHKVPMLTAPLSKKIRLLLFLGLCWWIRASM